MKMYFEKQPQPQPHSQICPECQVSSINYLYGIHLGSHKLLSSRKKIKPNKTLI